MRIIKNDTGIEKSVLQKMVTWLCQQADVPKARIRKAVFGTSKSNNYDGRMWYLGRTMICNTPTQHFPLDGWQKLPRGWAEKSPHKDRIDVLVHLTAHEIEHFAHYYHGGRRGQHEGYIDKKAWDTTLKFRDNRDKLLQKWGLEDDLLERVAAKSLSGNPERLTSRPDSGTVRSDQGKD